MQSNKITITDIEDNMNCLGKNTRTPIMTFTWFALFLQGLLCFFIKDTQFFVNNMDIVSIAIVLVTGVFFFISVSYIFQDATAITIVYLGYVFRVLLMFVDLFIIRIFHSGADSEGFYVTAVNKMAGFDNFMLGYGGIYTSTLSFVFRLFGPQRIIGQYINILLGITAVFFAWKILRKLGTDKQTQYVLLAVGLFLPNYAFLNSVFIREAPMAFLLAVSLYYFIIWLKDDKKIAFAVAVFLSAIAAVFHSAAIAPIAGYMFCLLFFDKKQGRFRLKGSIVVLSVMCVVMLMAIYQLFGDMIIRHYLRINTIDDVVSLLGVAGPAGSGYTIPALITGNSIADIIINAPIRVFFTLIVPFPWNWRGIADVITFVFCSVFYVYCYYLSVKLMLRRDYENKVILFILFIIALAGIFIVAWGVNNAGTVVRHRDKFFAVHLVLFSLCYYENRRVHLKFPCRKADSVYES